MIRTRRTSLPTLFIRWASIVSPSQTGMGSQIRSVVRQIRVMPPVASTTTSRILHRDGKCCRPVHAYYDINQETRSRGLPTGVEQIDS